MFDARLTDCCSVVQVIMWQQWPKQNDQMSSLSSVPANQPNFFKEKFFGLPLMSAELLWMTFFRAVEMQLLKRKTKRENKLKLVQIEK